MPESGTPRRIVIVGASLAGASAAVAIAEAGFDGETILLGDELHRPYERPPLSKAILLGEADEPDWVADEDFYAAHGIDLRLGVRVTAHRCRELDGDQSTAKGSATTGCCSPPARSRVASASRGPTPPASTSSAPSTSRSRFAPRSRPAPASSWSVRAGSGARWQPLRGTTAPT